MRKVIILVSFISPFFTQNIILRLRIGFAIAKKLAEDGAHVVVSSRNADKVDRAVNELRSLNLSVTGQVCHIGRPGEVEKLLHEVNKLYIKFNTFLTKFV